MKLRAFLSTVPLAAMALALPAKAEPRYVAVMDPCADEPKPRSSFRGWDVDAGTERNAATFIWVEKGSDGDSSFSRHGELRIWRESEEEFLREFNLLCRASAEWVVRRGPHPALAHDLYELALAS